MYTFVVKFTEDEWIELKNVMYTRLSKFQAANVQEAVGRKYARLRKDMKHTKKIIDMLESGEFSPTKYQCNLMFNYLDDEDERERRKTDLRNGVSAKSKLLSGCMHKVDQFQDYLG